MPVHSLEKRNDPRIVCGLLAREVLKNFGEPGKDEKRSVFYNNLKRLLQMYRFDTFMSHKPRGVLKRSPISNAKLIRGERKNAMSDVRTALEAAHNEIFGDELNTVQVVDFLTNVLDAMSSGDIQNLDHNDIEKARLFFKALENNIHTI